MFPLGDCSSAKAPEAEALLDNLAMSTAIAAIAAMLQHKDAISEAR